MLFRDDPMHPPHLARAVMGTLCGQDEPGAVRVQRAADR